MNLAMRTEGAPSIGATREARTILVVDHARHDAALTRSTCTPSRILNPLGPLDGIARAICYLKDGHLLEV